MVQVQVWYRFRYGTGACMCRYGTDSGTVQVHHRRCLRSPSVVYGTDSGMVQVRYRYMYGTGMVKGTGMYRYGTGTPHRGTSCMSPYAVRVQYNDSVALSICHLCQEGTGARVPARVQSITYVGPGHSSCCHDIPCMVVEADAVSCSLLCPA
jgi:hypothetical protein